MSKADNLKDFLTDVADAIRAKKGSTDLINPQNFSAEITALSGGLEVIEMTETTATIEPNKVYIWGMVESLDITIGASTGEDDFFAFRFRCSKPTMTVVTVNGATWADDTELDAQGKPVLDLGSWYQCEIKGGTSALYARLAHYIPFADSNVEAVLLANGVGDGLGITYKDAAKVTSISTWFKSNKDITAFAEFVNFSGITQLINEAFIACSSLAEITLPSSLTSIGQAAFNGCKLLARVLNLENTKVTSIGNGAFNGCSSLLEITLPAGLTSIGNYAFERCASLSSIVLPEGLTAIGQGAFVSCSALSLVIDLPNLTTLRKDAFSLSDVTRVENLGKISSIEDAVSGNFGMFRGNVNLTYVNLPDTLTSIGNCAFYGCTSLLEITLPAGLTSIGYSAFERCASLSSIVLPEGLTAIGQGAFVRCSALSLVIDLPNLTTLRKDAFSFSGVTRVENLGKISSIEDAVSGNFGMFRGNVNLTYVNLPDTLTSIGNNAFYGCSSLAEITLPASLTSIGGSTFQNCTSLQYIRIEATTPPTLASTNAIPSTIGSIYVPDESVAAYQAATNWSSFASKIKGISEMPA